jgi:hypothetical protein
MAKLLLISLLFVGDAAKVDGVGVLLLLLLLLLETAVLETAVLKTAVLEMAVLKTAVLEMAVLDSEDRTGAVVKVAMLLEIIADVVLMADVATERFTVKLESGQTVV